MENVDVREILLSVFLYFSCLFSLLGSLVENLAPSWLNRVKLIGCLEIVRLELVSKCHFFNERDNSKVIYLIDYEVIYFSYTLSRLERKEKRKLFVLNDNNKY